MSFLLGHRRSPFLSCSVCSFLGFSFGFVFLFFNDVSFGGLYLGSRNCIFTFLLLILSINRVCENTNNDVYVYL